MFVLKRMWYLYFPRLKECHYTKGYGTCNSLSFHLQLRLGLGLLKNRLHLGSLHHIALDLELAGHEQALSVGLTSNETREVGIGKRQSDCDMN